RRISASCLLSCQISATTSSRSGTLAISIVSTWLMARSQQRARLLEIQPRQPLEHFRGIAVAEVAEEVRLHAAVGKEFGVDLGVANPRHPAAVQAAGARRQHELGAL